MNATQLEQMCSDYSDIQSRREVIKRKIDQKKGVRHAPSD